MRFTIRVIFVFFAVLFLTSVSVIHILLGTDDRQQNARQRQRLSGIAFATKQGHDNIGKLRQNDGEFAVNPELGESQILRPPSHRNRRTHTRDKIKSSGHAAAGGNETNLRQELRVGWDVQEIKGWVYYSLTLSIKTL